MEHEQELINEVEKLQGHNRDAEAELACARDDLEAQQGRIEDLESQVTRCQDHIAAVEEELLSEAEARKVADEKSSQVAEQLKGVEAQHAECTQRVKELEEELDAAQAWTTEL